MFLAEKAKASSVLIKTAQIYNIIYNIHKYNVIY